jgi:hypothetical protein
MEKVMNQMEQQNTELTFTQMPQPMHSSSEMKAIFDCEETSIQSLPAPHTHTHTHAVLLCNQSAIPMLKCSQKRFLQEPRGVENWERMRKRIAKKDEESGVVEEWGEG